jgi:hypothetical protein
MMAIYGGCINHPEVVCVKSREELLSHVGRSFLVVMGDEALARELGRPTSQKRSGESSQSFSRRR